MDGVNRLRKSDHLIELRANGQLLLADRDHLSPFIVDAATDIHGLLDSLASQPAPDPDLVEMFEMLGLLGRFPKEEVEADPSPDDSLNVELHLLMTQSCNIDCVYCLNGSSTYTKGTEGRFSAADAFELIGWMRANHPAEVPITIHFFGGEPLLNWREIVRIVEYAARECANCRFYVTSNLTLLPAALLDAFKGRDVMFDVTVDGPEAVHDAARMVHRSRNGAVGTFRSVADNLAKLKAAGIPIAVKMVLSSINHRHIEETLRLHMQLGATFSSITSLRASDSDGADIAALLADEHLVWPQMESLARLYCKGEIAFEPASKIESMLVKGGRLSQYCGAGVEHSSVVDAQGRLFNCAWFVGEDAHMAGRKDGASVGYDLAVDQSFRERAMIEKNGGCAECNYRFVCGGPCPATRMKRQDEAGWSAFQKERRIKCAITKPIVNALLWKHGLDGQVA